MEQYVEAYRTVIRNLNKDNVIAHGVSGVVFKIADNVVAKHPFQEPAITEGSIYDQLGPHARITKLLGNYKSVIFLERLPYNLRLVLDEMQKNGKRVESKQSILWAQQLVDGLSHIHSCSVLQVDIGPHNILLDKDYNLKFVDFAGSSINGSKPCVFAGTKFSHPNLPDEQPSIHPSCLLLAQCCMK
jgi:serine/threonine protein kinase